MQQTMTLLHSAPYAPIIEHDLNIQSDTENKCSCQPLSMTAKNGDPMHEVCILNNRTRYLAHGNIKCEAKG